MSFYRAHSASTPKTSKFLKDNGPNAIALRPPGACSLRRCVVQVRLKTTHFSTRVTRRCICNSRFVTRAGGRRRRRKICANLSYGVSSLMTMGVCWSTTNWELSMNRESHNCRVVYSPFEYAAALYSYISHSYKLNLYRVEILPSQNLKLPRALRTSLQGSDNPRNCELLKYYLGATSSGSQDFSLRALSPKCQARSFPVLNPESNGTMYCVFILSLY